MPGRDLPDLEERLRLLPAALAVEAPAGLAERVARGGRRRRRLRRAAAAAVVAALVAAAVVTRAVVLDHTPTPVLNPGLLVGTATPEQLAGGHWRPLPVLPPDQLGGRSRPTVTWTGQELVVWGGSGHRGVNLRVHADGAGYDARTGRWGRLPLAPEAQLPDDDGAATVWTGREVLIWGGFTITDPVNNPNLGRPADGLAYDPARRTWRKLAARPPQLKPASGHDGRAVWTGRELLVTGVQEADARGGMVGGAYDPATDRWRLLPPSPALTSGSRHLQGRTAVWAGTRLLVWNFWSSRPRPYDESDATDPPGVEPDGIDLWAYNPASNRWTVLPTPPSEVRRTVVDGSMVWDGYQVVMVGQQVRVVAGADHAVAVAGRYDPDTARWTPIADSPPLRGRLRLAWAGAAVVELSSNAVYDPAGDRWLPLPAPPSPASPPFVSAGIERPLVRIDSPSRGGPIQLYVLEPARPEP
jgi:hypothetical protein